MQGDTAPGNDHPNHTGDHLTVHARTGTPQTVTFSNGKTADCLNFGNLHGTCRTLDATFGSVPLQDGLVSRDG